MALKAVLDTLDGLNDTLKGEYKKEGDKYVLDIEGGVETHPETAPLKNALDRVKTEKKDATTRLEQFKDRFKGVPDDFDAAKYTELSNALAGADPAKVDERLNKLREELTNANKQEVEKREKRIAKLDKVLNKRLVDGGLTKALVDAGIDKPYIEAAAALLKQSGKIKVVEGDDDFQVVADDGVSENTPLGEFVKKWSTSDQGKPMLAKASGGGSEGGNGGQTFEGNPWAKETRNLTKQQAMRQENPERARAMARAAGITPDW